MRNAERLQTSLTDVSSDAAGAAVVAAGAPGAGALDVVVADADITPGTGLEVTAALLVGDRCSPAMRYAASPLYQRGDARWEAGTALGRAASDDCMGGSAAGRSLSAAGAGCPVNVCSRSECATKAAELLGAAASAASTRSNETRFGMADADTVGEASAAGAALATAASGAEAAGLSDKLVSACVALNPDVGGGGAGGALEGEE